MKNRPDEKPINATIQITRSYNRLLDKEAKARNMSKAQMIKTAIKMYLQMDKS